MSLAGAEFGEQNLPGTYGADYVYPTYEELNYFSDQGMNVFRLPFRWERLQTVPGAELDADELARLSDVVAYATDKGASVILDPHNYARYAGRLIGEGPSVAEFADFWARLARIFSANPRVILGLMNEPHDIQAEAWLDAANAAIASIRAEGATNLILVAGTNWDGAANWYADWGFGVNAEVMSGVVDPADNFAIEVHTYFDLDSSGTAPSCVTRKVGSGRLSYFTKWLKEHKKRGFLGEFGASSDETCLAALDDTLSYLEANADVWAGFTYWAAGPWWGDYMFSIEPVPGLEKPQMQVLSKYLP